MKDHLKFLPKFRGVLNDGTKTNTLRKGDRSGDYSQGQYLRVIIDDELLFETGITSLEISTLGDFIGRPGIAKSEGFETTRELVEELERIYGYCAAEEVYTLISWYPPTD